MPAASPAMAATELDAASTATARRVVPSALPNLPVAPSAFSSTLPSLPWTPAEPPAVTAAPADPPTPVAGPLFPVRARPRPFRGPVPPPHVPLGGEAAPALAGRPLELGPPRAPPPRHAGLAERTAHRAPGAGGRGLDRRHGD